MTEISLFRTFLQADPDAVPIHCVSNLDAKCPSNTERGAAHYSCTYCTYLLWQMRFFFSSRLVHQFLRACLFCCGSCVNGAWKGKDKRCSSLSRGAKPSHYANIPRAKKKKLSIPFAPRSLINWKPKKEDRKLRKFCVQKQRDEHCFPTYFSRETDGGFVCTPQLSDGPFCPFRRAEGGGFVHCTTVTSRLTLIFSRT